MNEECVREPVCGVLAELKKQVARHEQQINEADIGFALIKQDLEYIKATLDKKNRLNASAVTMILQAVCTLIMTALAGYLGLS